MADKELAERENKKAPVANGTVGKRRRGVFKIIFDEVVAKNFQDIKKNFIQDIIVPSTLDWLYDVCISFVTDMFTSPGVGRSGSSLKSYSGSRTSYSSYYKGSKLSSSRDRRRDEEEDDIEASYKDINFPSRKDAEKVLAAMRGTIIDYGLVSVADLCDFACVSGTWADRKYGWTNLERASCFRDRDGRYYLSLPEPAPIEED